MYHIYISRIYETENYSAIKRNVCYSRDEPWICYTKWKKPVAEEYWFNDSTYMKYSE